MNSNTLGQWLKRGVVFLLALSGWITAWFVKPSSDSDNFTDDANPDSTRSATGNQIRRSQDSLAMQFSDEPSQNFMRNLSELSSAAAKPGVESPAFKRLADETLFDNDFERRMRNFGLLMEQLRPEDALMMHHEFVRMQQEGRPFGEEYALFATRWGEIDGENAIKYYFDVGNPSKNDVWNVLKGWGQKAPQDALQWMESSEYGSLATNDYKGHEAILVGWARLDPGAATDWIVGKGQEMPEGERASFLKPAIDSILLQKLYSDGVNGAADWLATLPEEGAFDGASANAWDQIAHQRLNRLAPELAAQTWQAIGDRKWVGIKEFSRFYDLVAAGNEGDDQPFFESLRGMGWDDSRFIAQFERWSEADVYATAGWLADKDRSTAVRKLAIQGMVNHLKESDPEAAHDWEKELKRE